MSTTEREVVTEVPSILDPRVERGAALLDEKIPGWAERTDPDALVLASTCKCILGLLHGEYFAGREALSISTHDATDLGFDVYDRRDYPALEQDWRLAILSRRESA